jgi:hypothetical protein
MKVDLAMSNNRAGHAHCCKNRKAPRTSSAFFALNYPSNPSGHKEVNNRLHNHERVPVEFKKPIHYKIRKGWYFRLSGTPDILDGSGDGKSRGKVVGFEHKSPDKNPEVNPKTPGDSVVCLNAANLKWLLVEPQSKLQAYGFTFTVPLEGSSTASGWIPLSSITFKRNKTKNRAKMMAALHSWACCLDRYAKWGRSLTKAGKTYRLRTVDELANAVKAMETDAASFKKHFRERTPGSLKNPFLHALDRARKSAESDGKVSEAELNGELVRWFRGAFGIYPRNPKERKKDGKWTPGVGNKLGDYLPKPKTPQMTGKAWTNLSANVSIGKKGATTAPIASDIFPEGHAFHRRVFKDGKRAWGYLYSPTPGKVIGRVEWYYGYCEVIAPVLGAEWKNPASALEGGARKQRRYGWVPAFAVE